MRSRRRPGLRESSWREPFASVARGAGLALRGERPGVRRAEDDPLRELPFRADILRVDSYGHPCGPRCFACAATNRQSWHQPRLSRRVDRTHGKNVTGASDGRGTHAGQIGEATFEGRSNIASDLGFSSWGGQDSNLRPTDYESASGRVHDLRRRPKRAPDLGV